MVKWLTPGRVAVIVGVLTGLASFVAGLVQVLPTKYSDTILAVAGVITTLGTLVKYLSGAQKFEATPIGQVTEAKRIGLQQVPASVVLQEGERRQ